MELLSNSTFQFVASISLTLVFGIISLWFTLRPTDLPPLAYTEISQLPISPDDEKVKQLLTKFDFSSWGSIKPDFQILTFKLWNKGWKTVVQNEENQPLVLEFNKIPILDCLQIDRYPEDLDCTCEVVEGKLYIRAPRLEHNDSITVAILIPTYLYKKPVIRKLGHAPKPMFMANNLRHSREMIILGIFFLCSSVYMFFSLRPQPHSPMLIGIWIAIIVGGVLFTVGGWAERKMPSSQEIPPSALILIILFLFIRFLPILIPIGIIAFLVHLWFGAKVLWLLFFFSAMVLSPFFLWYFIQTSIIGWLKKKQKGYNRFLVGFLVGIPFLAYYVMCAFTFIDIFSH